MSDVDCLAGLRIDVDTLRGTRLGVPALLNVLKKQGLKATIFFSVGPDNMGRHLWRLLRPAFLSKMLRSNAPNLYGWNILLRGTLWPGPRIGRRCAAIIRAAAEDGHEIGLHAWDHHHWQTCIQKMQTEAIRRDLEKGKKELEAITGQAVKCSAAPGWRCVDKVLTEKESLGFRYNTDCRGTSIFAPLVNGVQLRQPQIPVTLPTYDELISRKGISATSYNDYLLSLFHPEQLNVLTIHAEAEGIYCLDVFAEFLKKALAQNIFFVPLGDLLDFYPNPAVASLTKGSISGREGWVSFQGMQGEESHV
ncbi:4-deoxy-4-formamido-L-arabinose-phosphoundecaprenol deformylase [Desulfogranum japonicum]|uniref:4-deoxy-4-formamido-L-arabinose- phosphoundecaprenol deformylase n=1 Tax=Desulfogranum japonicum TaxID=231447 RepID=UPI0004259AB5|nr:4-deoxy-4-formamido-L-arabinose-phosphoundecaprenol deformylase [Desulfogranum japonicum]